jgi:MFS family permease
MEGLVLFRAVQGLGAGGVLPLAFTIIGELFSLEQRARMQGLFSGVWGVSSVIGPLIGGFLVDQVTWQWVFYINILPGLLAAALVWFAWRKPVQRDARVAIDIPGAVLLTLAVLALLLGLEEPTSPRGLGLLGGSAVLTALLLWVERRAADPILPLPLFRDRLFNVALLHGVLAGWAMFGSLNFVPLFVQAVLGSTATQAGISLTPMSLSWTVASILGSRLLLRVGYRTLAAIGMALLALGTLLMTSIHPETRVTSIMLYTGLMGIGMGLSIPAFLLAVQSTVPRQTLGAATSTIQFSRSIGGTLGVSVMGVFLSTRLAAGLAARGIDPATVSLESLIDPAAGASAALEGPVRLVLGLTIANLFVIASIAAVLGLAAMFLAPPGKIAQLVRERSGSNEGE